MIESNIIEWLDFDDTLQKIEPYSKYYLELYFRFLRTLLINKPFPIIIDIILIIISFMQIISISAIFISSNNDTLLEIFKYLKNILLFFDLISNDNTLYILFYIISFIIVINVILMIILLFCIQIIKNKILFNIVNILNIIIFYYLVGPAIDICLNIFFCGNEMKTNMYSICLTDSSHVKYALFSTFIFLLYIFITIIYSIYNNEIGSIAININENMTRVQSLYEFFYIITKIIIFILYFFVKTKFNSYIMKLILNISIFILCIIMSIYIYINVYYYNNIINYIVYYGWYFSSWFSFCTLMKILLNLKNITTFVLIGWIFFILLFHIIIKINNFIILSELKILEPHNIKSIEIITSNLLKLLHFQNNIKKRILLHGIIKNFEEYAKNNPEVNNHYQKLINDKYLLEKFDKEEELPILSIIYIFYHFQYEKAKNKDEIAIYICYFLINKFNNPAYAIFFWSKIKNIHHRYLYYKYILSEDIKDYLVNKLNRNIYNESVKYIQIGSLILYYLYMDLFKLKIYDAICDQIEYFDSFKEHFLTDKIIYNSLKIGDSLLKIRKEIMEIWDKIIELNPFNEESFKDYMVYLDNIIKDDILIKEESKKYILLKNEKFLEKYNIYNSMFLAGRSSIILVDGYLTTGKILYATPNFELLLSYNDKEILNINIEELLPSIIQSFYKELLDDSIKYSNINNIFKEQKICLLKNKNGGLINVKIFVKPVPNLCYGLIYFVYLLKINNPDFIILLDRNLKICGFSEIKGIELSYGMVTGYNLHHGLLGQHIGIIIPTILSLLDYKNGEFNIIKKDCKIKGDLYPISKLNKIKTKVDFILNKIKANKTFKEIHVEDIFQSIYYEYNDLIKELSKDKIKPYNIYYKIEMKSIFEGKYKYYKIYITDDIIASKPIILDNKENENENESHKPKKSVYNFENSTSREIKKPIKKKIIKNKKIAIINKLEEKTTNRENTHFNEKSNNNIEKNKEKYGKKEDNIENEENENISKYIFRTFNSVSSNIDIKFNKVKTRIINKKETFPIKVMFHLCIIFGFTTIFFLIFHQKSVENSFEKLSNFLDKNIFFNMTKMGVAVVYITATNIKWQLHLCNFYPFYNITLLNEEMLVANIEYLQWIKNFTNNLGKEFDEVVQKKYDIGLNIFEINEKEIFQLNNNNILNYFVKKAINLLKIYHSLLQFFVFGNKNELKPIDADSEINELNNLINQTYFYFISEINGFTKEEKIKKINKIFIDFPHSFLLSGLILLCAFLIFLFYTIRMNKIETYFIDKIINFIFYNLDEYIKQLDEIKKKLGNDTGVEDDEKEEDIDININISNSKDNSKKEEEEEKIEKKESNSNNFQTKGKNNFKKYKNKRIRIKKFKSYFIRINFFFEIKLLIIIIIYLSYYILSILFGKTKKNEFIDFDSINDSMIGVFKESYDIFISFKRQLQLYEENLTNCKISMNNNKEIYKIKIPSIFDIKTPNFGNAIMKITSGLDDASEALSNLTEIFSGDACKFLTNNQKSYELCGNFFWNGILLKGIEQTVVKMGDLIKTIIEELDSINNGGKSFNEILYASVYIKYELFIELYYQKTYRLIDDYFWAIRKRKLYYILKVIKNILLAYITISFFLLIILICFVFDMKNLFNSFLNFIAILPTKYLSEDENFYNDIIRIGSNYL